MNLANYRKEFSIFIYDENVHMARLLKESLTTLGYEAHFYSSDNLLIQAIYLALPHTVVLPFQESSIKLIADIKKISHEIQIVMVGEKADEEMMGELAAKDAIYDYVTEAVKYPKTFTHRIDRGIEKWLISLSKEEITLPPPMVEDKAIELNEKHNKLEFVETPAAPAMPAPSQESLLYELLSQTSETDAISWTLAQLSKFAGVEFAFLKYSSSNEILSLTEISTGITEQHANLGIKIEAIDDKEDFFQNPSDYGIWNEFFTGVCKADVTNAFVLQSSGLPLGMIVALGEINEDARTTARRFAKILNVLLEGHQKTRLIFDYMPIETKTFCLHNKAFYERLNDEVSRSRRINLPVSVASFEIRCFDGSLNLRAQKLVANVLKRFTRVTDFTGRISEKRFALALPHANLENAAAKTANLLNIIKAAIDEKKWTRVYVTAGVNEFPENVTDSMSLLAGSEDAADQAAPFEVIVYKKEEEKVATL